MRNKEQELVISSADFRANFSLTLNHVLFNQKTYLIKRNGKIVAKLSPVGTLSEIAPELDEESNEAPIEDIVQTHEEAKPIPERRSLLRPVRLSS